MEPVGPDPAGNLADVVGHGLYPPAAVGLGGVPTDGAPLDILAPDLPVLIEVE